MSPATVAAQPLPPFDAKTRAPALLATKTVRMLGRAASQAGIARLWRRQARLRRPPSALGKPIVNGQLVRAMLAPRHPLSLARTAAAGRQCVAWLSPRSATAGGPAAAGAPNQQTLIGHARWNGRQGASVSSSAPTGVGETTL